MFSYPKGFFIKFTPQKADLFHMDGTIVRTYHPHGRPIVQASVNNAGENTTVTLNLEGGHVEVYDWTGRIIRTM